MAAKEPTKRTRKKVKTFRITILPELHALSGKPITGDKIMHISGVDTILQEVGEDTTGVVFSVVAADGTNCFDIPYSQLKECVDVASIVSEEVRPKPDDSKINSNNSLRRV